MFEISHKLASAYPLKNEFICVIRSKNSTIGKSVLLNWIKAATAIALPELESCLKACHNWFHKILIAMDFPWSNGYTEGCNNKIKVLKYVCYDVHNFKHFRNRVLFS